MNALLLVVVLAVLTYASRAAAFAAPAPPPGVREALDRVPAPLFAALAGLSLVQASGALAAAPVLGAAAGAILLSLRRSVPLVVLGGAVGYAAALALHL